MGREPYVKNSIGLDSEPQICMRYLKSFIFLRRKNNTVHIVMRLPHSGFGLYAPQRISAKVVGSADGKTVLHLSARPLIPTECLIILFNALSVFFIIFTLRRKCAPYFLLTILAFTILLTGEPPLWQAKACLNRFAEKICRRFCSE